MSFQWRHNPANTCLFKVKNKNTRKRCEINEQVNDGNKYMFAENLAISDKQKSIQYYKA